MTIIYDSPKEEATFKRGMSVILSAIDGNADKLKKLSEHPKLTEEAREEYRIRLKQTEELEELCIFMLNTKKSWK